MAGRLAKILEQEYKTKGLVGGLASAGGKRLKEMFDIRNVLFSGGGIGSQVGKKIFGKGYSATAEKDKAESITNRIQPPQQAFSQESIEILSSIKNDTRISAKNSVSLPQIAMDINLAKLNIMKLVRLQGDTAEMKADMFFKRAGAREDAYESQFKKGSKNSPQPVAKSESKSLIQQLFTGLLSLGGIITGALSTLGTVIAAGLAGLGTLLLGKNLLSNSMPNIPDTPDGDKKGNKTTKGGGKPPTSGGGKLGNVGRAVAGGAKGGIGLGLLFHSPEVGAGSDVVPNQSTSPSPMGFDYNKYKELVAQQESGNKSVDNKVGFLGKYQFGAQALETFGYLKPGTSKGNDKAVYEPSNWTGKDGMRSKDDFLNNLQVQEALMQKYTQMNMVGLDKAGVMKGVEGDGAAVASRLYAAHHGGVGGAKALFLQGKDTNDKYLTGASVGKSASNMASLYSSGSAPSGATINEASVAIASPQQSTSTPSTTTPTVNIDNSKTQMSSGSSGTQVSAWDNLMFENMITRVI
jgi:hypothetical protein